RCSHFAEFNARFIARANGWGSGFPYRGLRASVFVTTQLDTRIGRGFGTDFPFFPGLDGGGRGRVSPQPLIDRLAHHHPALYIAWRPKTPTQGHPLHRWFLL